MLKSNIKTAITDFEWVLKILESSEDENHMNCTLRCFQLWESRYFKSSPNRDEKKVLSRLSDNFWAIFKNKNNTIGTINIQ
jgi:hypothetical protein